MSRRQVLNLWMRNQPFTLDGLVDVPRYVYKGSYMSKCDDKSGYDHVLLTVSSQTYVGFQWESCYLVCATLPFGWKISPYIYHTIGSAATTFFVQSVDHALCILMIDLQEKL